MTKKSSRLTVTQKRDLSSGYFVLEVTGAENAGSILPGQFVQVLVENSRETFLRRPISVYDTDLSDGKISLLIKIAGPGTKRLSELREGDELDIIYPLGNNFTIPSDNETVLLVGGGVGVAPLYLLGRKLRDAGQACRFLLGYKTKDQVVDLEKFKRLGELEITTEDGSMGIMGVVTDHPLLKSPRYDMIYCCGPEPMMKAVAILAADNGIDCEVSLEHMMACGFGVCLCCVVETDKGNICTCTEGPVFNIKRLKWQT